MKYLYTFLFIATVCFSCTKDFEEINRNPFDPTQVDIGPLFNNVIASLRLDWNEQFYVHTETLYGVTQLAAKTAIGFDNITIGTEGAWNNYYRSLAHIREVEKRLDEIEIEQEALNNVRAQVKITFGLQNIPTDRPLWRHPFFRCRKRL